MCVCVHWTKIPYSLVCVTLLAYAVTHLRLIQSMCISLGKSRPRCYTKAPTVQDVFQSIP